MFQGISEIRVGGEAGREHLQVIEISYKSLTSWSGEGVDPLAAFVYVGVAQYRNNFPEYFLKFLFSYIAFSLIVVHIYADTSSKIKVRTYLNVLV